MSTSGQSILDMHEKLYIITHSMDIFIPDLLTKQNKVINVLHV